MISFKQVSPPPVNLRHYTLPKCCLILIKAKFCLKENLCHRNEWKYGNIKHDTYYTHQPKGNWKFSHIFYLNLKVDNAKKLTKSITKLQISLFYEGLAH